MKKVKDKSGKSSTTSLQVYVGDSGHSSLNLQCADLHSHYPMHQPTLPTSAADESVANDHDVPYQDMENTNNTSTIVNGLTSAEMFDVNRTDNTDAMVTVDVTDIALPDGLISRKLMSQILQAVHMLKSVTVLLVIGYSIRATFNFFMTDKLP